MLSQHILMKLIPMETNLAKQNLLSPSENKVLQILKKGTIFNPIKDGPFRGCSRMGGQNGSPKICSTYPTMMKLGTVIPYLKI